MHLFDNGLVLDGARRTGDGYLVADVKVARTGIQLYKGSEVGRPDLDVVRVYRPEAEVFAQDALHSFAWKPVTFGHPKDAVNADNWRKLAVGQVGDEVKRDGDFVRVPLVLMDASVIREVEAGTRQLSMGYSAELVWGDGTTPTGEAFDATQVGIRANHLAVVTVARGGPALAIDGQETDGKDQSMTAILQKLMVDGIQCEVTDVSAAIINRHIASLQGQIDKLTKAAEEAEDKAKAAKDAADAEIAKVTTEAKQAADAAAAQIATLTKQVEDAKVTPAHLDQLAKDRGDAIEKARKVVGDKLVVDGKTTAEVKRQAVDAYLGDAAKAFSDDQVDIAFATMTAKDTGTARGADPVRDGIRRAGGLAPTDDRAKAWEESGATLRDAWQHGNPPAVATRN